MSAVLNHSKNILQCQCQKTPTKQPFCRSNNEVIKRVQLVQPQNCLCLLALSVLQSLKGQEMLKERFLLFCKEGVRSYRSKIYLWGREKRNQAPTEPSKIKIKNPILDLSFFFIQKRSSMISEVQSSIPDHSLHFWAFMFCILFKPIFSAHFLKVEITQ